MEQAFTIRDLRKELGLTIEEFGARIGQASKGRVSVIETSGRASLAVALKIEQLSILDGKPRIDAALLNDDVAAARAAQQPDPPACHGCDASASAPESADDGSSPAHCDNVSGAGIAGSMGQCDEMSRQDLAA